MEPGDLSNYKALYISLDGVKASSQKDTPKLFLFLGKSMKIQQPRTTVASGNAFAALRPSSHRTQIMEYILVNESVHTACKQHQKVCTQIVRKCAYVSCANGA